MRTPPRFAEARVSDLDTTQMMVPLDYWKNRADMARCGIGLLLSGPPGVGKSYCLAAFTNSLVRIDSEFVNASKSLSEYLAFDDPVWDARRNQPMDLTLESVDWLVLNDLGKEYRGGKLQDQMTFKLGSLLRARSEGLKITHITTNLYPASKIRDVYGDSVASLLSEMCKIVEVTGKDRRNGC